MRAAEATSEVVEITGGRVAGDRRDGVSRFLGIPYGRPTGGVRRFRAPRPRAAWGGTLPVRGYGPACPQPPIRQNLVIDPEVERAMFSLNDEPQSEDCLSLNLWTSGADDAARPVMVSLHAGGFKSGSGSARSAPWFDGTRLAARGDVVVVTVNHRIGVLGHLALDAIEGSGNAGLLDLVGALEWIRDHVACFGGDPSRVTIFGESGGGGKVLALMAMPAATGLFHRAAAQSATLDWLSPEEAGRVTRSVMDALGVDSVPQLAAVGVRRMVDAGATVTRAGMRFGPVIDGTTLPRGALDSLAHGASADVPLMIGVTRDEAAAFLPVGGEMGWDAVERRFGERATGYRGLHPGFSARRALIDLMTDDMFRSAALGAAEVKSSRPGAPVFVFEFAWRTPVLGGRLGAAHGVDVAFPFDNTELHPASAGSASARRLAPVVSDCWIAFARDGDPRHDDLSEWPPHDAAGGATLVFDDECHLARRPSAGSEGAQPAPGETVTR